MQVLQAAMTRVAGWPLAARMGMLWAAGAASALAFPPLHLIPVLFVVMPLTLALMLRAPSWRQAAALGWAFAFGQFAAGLYWIGYSFQVDADAYGALAVPAVGGLTAALGLFGAVTGALTWRLIPAREGQVREGLAREGLAPAYWGPMLFAAVFTLMEMLRAVIFTGFPWNLMATVWTPWPVMIGSVSLFGAYGLSFLTVWAAAAPVALVFDSGKPWRPATLPLVPLLCSVFAGLGPAATSPADAPVVRIVQPNVPQKDKWKGELRRGHFESLMQLSAAEGNLTPDVVVWPETASPYPVFEMPSVVDALRTVAPETGSLVTGTVRREGDYGTSSYRVFNSLAVITRDGGLTAMFDKAHLVPFGEYMPLRALIPVDQLTGGGTDFSPGPGLVTLPIPGAPTASPLICYEIIFPGRVMPAGRDRPGWIVNITNDAWFGFSSGPYQHLAAAQLRAAEEGVPVVRAANTGISAMIAPDGRLLARLDLGQKGVIDHRLPDSRPPTVFSYTGSWPVLIVLLGLVVSAAIIRAKRAR